MRTSLLIGLLAFQSAVATQRPFVLERSRVGPVAIGASAQSVYEAFRGRAKLVDLQLEGDLSPALELRLVSAQMAPSLVAEIGAAGNMLVVNRIHVLDRSLRTKEGIGVGSSFGELRGQYTVAWISMGEGSLGARVESLGMTFELDASGRPALFSIRDPAQMPADVRIASIMLTR